MATLERKPKEIDPLPQIENEAEYNLTINTKEALTLLRILSVVYGDAERSPRRYAGDIYNLLRSDDALRRLHNTTRLNLMEGCTSIHFVNTI